MRLIEEIAAFLDYWWFLKAYFSLSLANSRTMSYFVATADTIVSRDEMATIYLWGLAEVWSYVSMCSMWHYL